MSDIMPCKQGPTPLGQGTESSSPLGGGSGERCNETLAPLPLRASR